MTTHTTYSKFAFISYSHRDMKVAKWLHRKLEAFRLPSEVHNDIEAGSKYLRPVFRDQEDLNTGILSDVLRRNLEESKFLILICSKNSARSEWVSAEAKAFVEMGRLDHIIPVIIPDSHTPEPELFPAFLRDYFRQNPGTELLGVNIGEVGRQKALIRIISRMLDVSFDSLWKRHQRQKRIRIATTAVLCTLAALAAYIFALPVNVSIAISPRKSNLPTGEDISLFIDGAAYSVPMDDPNISGIQIPGYKRFSAIDIRAKAAYFEPVDTLISTGFGLSKSISIPLLRDDSFAIYGGVIFDTEMNPLEGATVTVLDFTDVTDAEGRFRIEIPLPLQRTEHTLSISKPGLRPMAPLDSISPSPDHQIIYRE